MICLTLYVEVLWCSSFLQRGTVKLFLVYWCHHALFGEEKFLICELAHLFSRGSHCHLLMEPYSKLFARSLVKKVFCTFFICHIMFYPR